MRNNTTTEQLTTEITALEQAALDHIIQELDASLAELDSKLYEAAQKAKEIKTIPLADVYGALVSANKDVSSLKAQIQDAKARKHELYEYRLVINGKGTSEAAFQEDLYVGLHGYFYGDKQIIYSWYSPVCVHFILANREDPFTYRSDEPSSRMVEEYVYSPVLKRKIEIIRQKVNKAIDLFNSSVILLIQLQEGRER